MGVTEIIDVFETDAPFTPQKKDDVVFCTETEEKKRFLGRVTDINSDGTHTFYDIKPIQGKENKFPNVGPSLVARVTRGFILHKLNLTN